MLHVTYCYAMKHDVKHKTRHKAMRHMKTIIHCSYAIVTSHTYAIHMLKATTLQQSITGQWAQFIRRQSRLGGRRRRPTRSSVLLRVLSFGSAPSSPTAASAVQAAAVVMASPAVTNPAIRRNLAVHKRSFSFFGRFWTFAVRFLFIFIFVYFFMFTQ